MAQIPVILTIWLFFVLNELFLLRLAVWIRHKSNFSYFVMRLQKKREQHGFLLICDKQPWDVFTSITTIIESPFCQCFLLTHANTWILKQNTKKKVGLSLWRISYTICYSNRLISCHLGEIILFHMVWFVFPCTCVKYYVIICQCWIPAQKWLHTLHVRSVLLELRKLREDR